MKYLFFLLAAVCSLIACNPNTVEEENSMNGTWRSLGSGWLLEIKDSTSYSFFDLTQISCLPNRRGPLKELEVDLNAQGDTLTLIKGVSTYQFIRTDKLPARCTEQLLPAQKSDPLYNFDVFAETVEEHYAFLDLNSVNWELLKHNQRDKLTATSTEVELYRVIDQTLTLLNDNHAFLEASDEVYELLESEGTDSAEDDLPEIGDFQVAQWVAQNHLEKELTRDSWLIQWGLLTNDIGYIQIKAMWLYAQLDIPQAAITEKGYVDAYVETRHQMYEGAYIQKESLGVASIMSKVIQDLSKTKSIVVDIRFNGGGQDAVSREVLRHFLIEPVIAGEQKFKFGNQYSPSTPYLIKPAPNTYTKPVFVLISPQTGSAAEFFALTTLAVDHIKLVGSSTDGATSTTLDKTLPNGWSFSISNEVITDINGKNYENIGVPPEYEMGYIRDRQAFFRSVAEDLPSDKLEILRAVQSYQ